METKLVFDSLFKIGLILVYLKLVFDSVFKINLILVNN